MFSISDVDISLDGLEPCKARAKIYLKANLLLKKQLVADIVLVKKYNVWYYDSDSTVNEELTFDSYQEGFEQTIIILQKEFSKLSLKEGIIDAEKEINDKIKEKTKIINSVISKVNEECNQENRKNFYFLLTQLANAYGPYGLSIKLDSPANVKNETRVLTHAHYTHPTLNEMVTNFEHGLNDRIIFSLLHLEFLTLSYNKETREFSIENSL